MPTVAGRISVLMTLNSRDYRSGLLAANTHTKEFKATADRLNVSTASLRRVTNSLTEANFASLPPLQRLVEDNRTLGMLADTGAISFNQYARSLRQNAKAAISLGNPLRFVAQQLGVIRTVAIGLTAATAFQQVAEGLGGGFAIERSLARVNIIADTFDREAQQLRSSLLNLTLNPDFAGSANEIGDSMVRLARDGLAASEIIGRLPGLLNFAAASQTDLGQATEETSDVFVSWRQNVGSASEQIDRYNEILDLLTGSSLEADVTTSQLAQSLVRSAPLLTSFTNNLEEALAISVGFAELGNRGERAGEDILRAFRDLLRVASENRRELEAAFGFDLFDEQGKLIDNSPIRALEQLRNLVSGLSDEQELDFLRSLGFQDKSIRPLLQIIDATERLREIVGQQAGFAGVTETVAQDARTNTERLISLVQGISSVFSNRVIVTSLNALSRVLTSTDSKGTTRLSTFAKTVGFATVAVGGFVAASRLVNGVLLAGQIIAQSMSASIAQYALTTAGATTTTVSFTGALRGLIATRAGLSLLAGSIAAIGLSVAALSAFSEETNVAGLSTAATDRIAADAAAARRVNPENDQFIRQLSTLREEGRALEGAERTQTAIFQRSLGFGPLAEQDRIRDEIRETLGLLGEFDPTQALSFADALQRADTALRSINDAAEETANTLTTVPNKAVGVLRQLGAEFDEIADIIGENNQEIFSSIEGSIGRFPELFKNSLTELEKFRLTTDELLKDFVRLEADPLSNLDAGQQFRLLERELESLNGAVEESVLANPFTLTDDLERFRAVFGVSADAARSNPVVDELQKLFELIRQGNIDSINALRRFNEIMDQNNVELRRLNEESPE